MNKDNKVVLGIALLGLLLTLSVFVFEFRVSAREAARDYAIGLSAYSEGFEHSIFDAEVLLKSLQTLFYSHRDLLDEATFNRYTSERLIQYDGLDGITFLRRVNDSQRVEYEQLMRGMGKYDYRIQPVDGEALQDNTSEMHLAACYVTSLDSTGLQQAGRDWLSHIALKDKLQEAVRRNEVTSAVYANKLFMFLAVYSRDFSIEDVDNREAALIGVLALQYDLGLLLRQSEWPTGLRLELVSNEQAWALPVEKGLLPTATALYPVKIGQQEYRLQLHYPIVFSDISTAHMTLVLVAGLLLTVATSLLYRAYAQRLALLRASAEMGLRVISDQADMLEQQDIELEQQKQVLDEHAIVSIADIAGRITYVNNKFCDVSGYCREELLGQNHRILRSGEHAPEFYADMWATISSGKTWHGMVCNRCKDGSLYWVDSTIRPILDQDGKPDHYISARTDVTVLMNMRKTLSSRENDLLQTQSFANMGSWDWNIQTGKMTWSEQVLHILGRANTDYEPSYENYLQVIPPEDREQVINAIGDCNQNGRELFITHRVIWPNRSIHWLQLRGNVTRAEDGTPLHLLCIVQDITRRTQMEQTVDKQKQLLDMLREAMLHFVQTPSLGDIAKDMLTALLRITDCRLGFFAEVNHDNGVSDLKMHAVSNIAWDKASQEQYALGQLVSRDKKSLISHVLNNAQPLLSNNAEVDPRRGGVPPGHGKIENFLGVPVFYGDEMVGMYALANREGGFDRSIIDFLQPLQVTYGILIQAMRNAEQEEQTRQDLLNAKLDAEHASRSKSEFLSHMSHELRTPLNAIMGFSQLLIEDIQTPLTNDQHESTKEIYHAGQHLLELVNEVLDLARIESGRMEVRCESVLLQDVCEQCSSLMQQLAEMYEIQLHQDWRESEDVWVMADHVRLKQVLINLVSNAIKYNNAGGAVRLRAEKRQGGRVRLTVLDTGPGLSAEDQDRVFTPFERLGAEKTSIEGSGIGLTITRRMVELMGGKIGLDSVLGQGCCFWVELDSSAAIPAVKIPERVEKMPGAVVEQESDVVTGDKPYKLLYVEDNPANIRLVQLLMRQYPEYELVIAETGEEGVRLAQSEHPDIVLMDINLPGISGLEATALLRGDLLTKDIPVIAVSANATQEDKRLAAEAGIVDYLTKPLDAKVLFAALKKTTVGDDGRRQY